jgi:hypothetical protein
MNCTCTALFTDGDCPKHGEGYRLSLERMKPEIYCSTDIETDGPTPGLNSMLSFATAAFTADGTFVGSWTANLTQIDGGIEDPKTMDWWRLHPGAWEACRVDPQLPRNVMPLYCDWVEQLPGNPIFVAYPAGFDFTFMYFYTMTFAGRRPFGFSALDMKTFACARLGLPYANSVKKSWPADWKAGAGKHTHTVLDDALEQGRQFLKMRKWFK